MPEVPPRHSSYAVLRLPVLVGFDFGSPCLQPTSVAALFFAEPDVGDERLLVREFVLSARVPLRSSEEVTGSPRLMGRPLRTRRTPNTTPDASSHLAFWSVDRFRLQEQSAPWASGKHRFRGRHARLMRSPDYASTPPLPSGLQVWLPGGGALGLPQVGFAPTGRLTRFRNANASCYSFWTRIAWSLPIFLSSCLFWRGSGIKIDDQRSWFRSHHNGTWMVFASCHPCHGCRARPSRAPLPAAAARLGICRRRIPGAGGAGMSLVYTPIRSDEPGRAMNGLYFQQRDGSISPVPTSSCRHVSAPSYYSTRCLMAPTPTGIDSSPSAPTSWFSATCSHGPPAQHPHHPQDRLALCQWSGNSRRRAWLLRRRAAWRGGRRHRAADCRTPVYCAGRRHLGDPCLERTGRNRQ